MSNRSFYISSSPHVFDGDSVNRIMWTVSAALAPAAAWGVYVYGLPALMVLLYCIASSMLFEALAQKLKGSEVSLDDGSAVLTGAVMTASGPQRTLPDQRDAAVQLSICRPSSMMQQFHRLDGGSAQ